MESFLILVALRSDVRKGCSATRAPIAPLNHAGWEVTLEREGERTRHVYDDWHRVERALARFELEVNQLREQGWHETRP
jgi:hypothetical protein